MESYFGWLLVAAPLLVAVVFLLNGFGIMAQTIPAKEMLERDVPAGIVPLAMFAGRTLEIVAGFGLVWRFGTVFFLLPDPQIRLRYWLELK